MNFKYILATGMLFSPAHADVQSSKRAEVLQQKAIAEEKKRQRTATIQRSKAGVRGRKNKHREKILMQKEKFKRNRAQHLAGFFLNKIKLREKGTYCFPESYSKDELTAEWTSAEQRGYMSRTLQLNVQ